MAEPRAFWHLRNGGSLKDLVAMLKTLPLTLRSVELSFLLFKDEDELDHHLAESMREKLGWSSRTESERPVVTMHVPQHYLGAYLCVDEEINEFLYEGWTKSIEGATR